MLAEGEQEAAEMKVNIWISLHKKKQPNTSVRDNAGEYSFTESRAGSLKVT